MHFTILLVILSTVASSSEADSSNSEIYAWRWSIEGLEAAMQGFDPMMSDRHKCLNPGLKNNIFVPLTEQADGSNILNPFVEDAKKIVCCSGIFNRNVIKNFNSYKSQSEFNFFEDSEESKNNEMPDSLYYSTRTMSFRNLSSYGRKDNNYEKNIEIFFLETRGEIIELNTECITYSVSVSSFIKPVFTRAFQEGLSKLHTAAEDPDSDASNKTFAKFVREFGTHYMKNTKLGSKIYFQKLFVFKSRDQHELIQRQECVENSARQSILNNSVLNWTASFREESKKCDKEANFGGFFLESVIPIGSFPANFENWSTTSTINPVPISYELDKISHITRPEWVDDIGLSDDAHDDIKWGHLNGTLISRFLEYKYTSYCQLLLGTECPTPKRGCGFDSYCPDGTFCVTDEREANNYRCENGELIFFFLIVLPFINIRIISEHRAINVFLLNEIEPRGRIHYAIYKLVYLCLHGIFNFPVTRAQ